MLSHGVQPSTEAQLEKNWHCHHSKLCRNMFDGRGGAALDLRCAASQQQAYMLRSMHIRDGRAHLVLLQHNSTHKTFMSPLGGVVGQQA
jgi:hypothetical protein